MEHELIDRLVRDATPVRPLARPAVRLVRWALAAALCLAAGVAWVHLRHDLAETMWTASFLGQAGLLIGTALLAATAALVVSVPGAEPTPATRWLPLVAITAWAAWLFAAIVAQPEDSRVWWPAPAPQCGVDITLLGIVPGVLLWSLVRRAAPLRPAWTGLLATLTAAALGALGTQLICSNNDAAHLLLWHFGPVTMLTVAGIALGRRFLRWLPRPS
ncbi:hypothetical protein LuPra_01404 [Luteitalea pratensis]|uniref:DUF1109 domain-containing protein n=1 Tax=Luteitalea pratensis TaxID=1855912 RepID=A0A143PI88_LUTPR|nr:DUF1109 domain-containing protein [Luteitalea pratensis]AMY08211.1 hypothetical protein LuPra_01404 [Luteitalea pratensis]